MTQSTEDSTQRRIGLPTASALVVANMIGVGVFTTSGFALADLGQRHLVLLAWLIGGVLAMLGALSYGALARRMPESGGEYVFLHRTVHPLAGFVAGWVSLLAGFTAPIAIAALALEAYLAPLLGDSVRPEWIGTAAIAAAALMHGVRLRHGVVVLNVAVLLKLILILGFIVVGALLLPARSVASVAVPSVPLESAGATGFPIGAFAVSLVWISFSYAGWNAAVYVASEVREPRRNLNRSLWVGTTLVTSLYIALNAVFVYAAPVEDLAGRVDVGAIAAEALGGEALRTGVSLLVAVALVTSISAMTMIGPRVYQRMAQDGLFPRAFATRGDVPAAAVALQALLAVLAVWITGMAELLGYAGFTLGLCTAGTVLGLISLRRKEGAKSVPIPGYPWIPLLFVVATLGATGFMMFHRPFESGMGLLTLAAGVPLYWLLRWKNRRDTGETNERGIVPCEGIDISAQ